MGKPRTECRDRLSGWPAGPGLGGRGWTAGNGQGDVPYKERLSWSGRRLTKLPAAKASPGAPLARIAPERSCAVCGTVYERLQSVQDTRPQEVAVPSSRHAGEPPQVSSSEKLGRQRFSVLTWSFIEAFIGGCTSRCSRPPTPDSSPAAVPGDDPGPFVGIDPPRPAVMICV